MTRQSHARRLYSPNWGVLICACGAVGHEEVDGNLLAWHARHKQEMRVTTPTPSGHKAAKEHRAAVPERPQGYAKPTGDTRGAA